jgi:hypothetical protein
MLPVAINIPLAQADAGGTGKFLTVEIIGEGYVKAVKVKPDETWEFYWADPPMSEKVGAGTVLLSAFASEGWEFSHWGGNLTGSENPTDYKTQKYGYVIAVFVKKTYTIFASAVGNGTISPDGEVLVEHGANQTFEFSPFVGNHISAIVVDDVYLSSYAQNYTFCNVVADHTIDVYFSADGTAAVPAGPEVTVFLASGAGLTFDYTDGGVATGEEETYYPVGALEAVFWDISVTFTFTGEVLVTLEYDDTGLSEIDELNLRLVKAESLEALRSDVNNDLVVDSTDTSIVAEGKNQPYDPRLDLNNDGYITNADIDIVNENKGTILVDITDGINTDLNVIWGTTDATSIFGAR